MLRKWSRNPGETEKSSALVSRRCSNGAAPPKCTEFLILDSNHNFIWLIDSIKDIWGLSQWIRVLIKTRFSTRGHDSEFD